MTNTRLLRLAPLAGLVLAILGLALPALAQGPLGQGFSYQGRLRLGQSYMDNVSCDFTFGLFDAPAGGQQLGQDQPVTGVPVADGYFRVTLNQAGQFGPAAFSGDRRYLAIAVRCPGDAGFTPMGGRVELQPVPYARYALNATDPAGVDWAIISGKPAGFADDIDDENPYTAGFGLALTATQFSLVSPTVLSAISHTVQLRVAGGCTGNESVQLINPDGSVVCAPTATIYQAGDGLRLESGGVLAIDETVVQRRVIPMCGSPTGPEAIRSIDSAGQVQCEQIAIGDITAVQAGAALTATNSTGPGPVTVNVLPGGIEPALLADGAVTGGKLDLAAVTSDKIANEVVNASHVADGTIRFSDLALCSSGQILKWSGTAWSCGSDEGLQASAGDGIVLTGTTLSARLGDGLAFDSNGAIVADFVAANSQVPADGTGLPLGNSGGAASVARSDHQHDVRYPQRSTTPTPADVTGSYSGGFNVVRINGRDVVGSPSSGNVLAYNGSQWAPAPYGFTLDICVREVFDDSGEAIATCSGACPSGSTCNAACPAASRRIGGGCACEGNEQIVDSEWRSGGWRCNCAGSNDATAYAVCALPEKQQ